MTLEIVWHFDSEGPATVSTAEMRELAMAPTSRVGYERGTVLGRRAFSERLSQMRLLQGLFEACFLGSLWDYQVRLRAGSVPEAPVEVFGTFPEMSPEGRDHEVSQWQPGRLGRGTERFAYRAEGPRFPDC